jgi:outer membrane protein assembly factor BamB
VALIVTPGPHACRVCGEPPGPRARFCGRCGAGVGLTDGPGPGTQGGRTRRSRWMAPPRPSAALVSAVLVTAMIGGLGATAWLATGGAPDTRVVFPERRDLLASSEGSRRFGERAVDGTGSSPPFVGTTCDGPTDAVPCVAWRTTDHVPARAPAESRIVGSVLASTSADGRLVGFDVFRGRIRWERQIGAGARLWPAIGGSLPVSVGEGTVVLSVADGSTLGGFAGDIVAAEAHGAWMLVATPEELSARLVTRSGGPRPPAWRREIRPGERTWLTSGGAYLDHGAGELRALHSNTGRERWRLRFDGPVVDVLRSGEGTAIAIGGIRPRVITVARDGTVLGEAALPSVATQLSADPAGRVIAAVTEETHEAVLHLIDAQTGRSRGSLPLGGSGAIRPSVRSGLVAVATSWPTPTLVVALDGGLLALRQTLPSTPSQVVLSGNRTVVVLEEEHGSAWSLVTGQQRWRTDLGPAARLVAGRELVVESEHGLTALVADPPR